MNILQLGSDRAETCAYRLGMTFGTQSKEPLPTARVWSEGSPRAMPIMTCPSGCPGNARVHLVLCRLCVATS